MLRVFLTHLYVIVMAIVVITTGNIIADRYADDIIGGIKSLWTSSDEGIEEMKSSVKDWNKKVLD
jgi:hypothetical protein